MSESFDFRRAVESFPVDYQMQQVLREEAAAVLADQRFARSKVMSRLLSYLMEQTLAGTVATLKSCTIAVEALGRSEQGTEDDDAYARVAVGRLRRALDEFYTQESHRPFRLIIERGDYEVRLIPLGNAAAPDVTSLDAPAAPGPSGRLMWARWRGVGGAILLLAAAVLAYTFWHSERVRSERWARIDFPVVRIQSHDPASPNSAALAQAITDRLSGLTSLRTIQSAQQAQFLVEIRDLPSAQGPAVGIDIIAQPSGRIFFARHYPAGSNDDNALVDRIATDVGGPLGAIHTFNRRNPAPVDTPYRCWLTFTANLTTLNTVNDRVFSQCAADWYAVNQDHPMAVALYGWSLVDKANRENDDTDRLNGLRQASQLLSAAIALNGDAGTLHLARLRTQAMLEDGDDVAMEADEVFRLARQNPEFRDFARLVLAFWGLPEPPEAQTLAPSGVERTPMPAATRMVRAMLASDVTGAAREMETLKDIEVKQPGVALFEAAILVKQGRAGEARAILKGFCHHTPFFTMSPARIIERMPIGPLLRARLLQWLQPLRKSGSDPLRCD